MFSGYVKDGIIFDLANLFDCIFKIFSSFWTAKLSFGWCARHFDYNYQITNTKEFGNQPTQPHLLPKLLLLLEESKFGKKTYLI